MLQNRQFLCGKKTRLFQEISFFNTETVRFYWYITLSQIYILYVCVEVIFLNKLKNEVVVNMDIFQNFLS